MQRRRQEERNRGLLELSRLNGDVFTHNQPVGSHLFYVRQNTINVIGGVNEGKHQRKLAAGINQRCRLDPPATGKAGDSMEHRGAGNFLLAQILEQFQVQRLAVPFVSFIQVDRNLDGDARLVHE